VTGLALALVIAAAPLKLSAGPLTLELTSSESAQQFHIVDQLSQWSPFSHKQYRRALKLDADDEAALKAHAELRKRLAYGPLDQAFYLSGSLDEAYEKLSKHPKLTRDDVQVERKVMKQLAPKVLPFIRERASFIDDYLKQLAQGELEALAAKADHFFGCGPATLPAVLIPSTKGNGGGGVNGGVLTVEVGPDDDISTLLHESWHALGKCKQVAMDEAGKRTGTTMETYSEGLAYAVSPGLFRKPGSDVDRLAEKVAADLAAHKSLSDAYVRFNRLGLALRPTLKKALEDGKTFDEVLPVELALFAGLREVEAASEPKTPYIFCFGKPCMVKALIERIAQQRDTSIWGRELVGAQIASLADRIRPRDTVLLFPEGALPAEAQKLCGDAYGALAPKLAADAGFEQVDSALAHVTVAWGPEALSHVAVALGLDGGL
jgi:hypothetical protein